MPWETSDEREARRRFIAGMLRCRNGPNMAAMCRCHGISRECGYKWWRRFREGGMKGLVEQARTPRCARELRARWWDRLQRVVRQEKAFGPKKLRWKLRRLYPGTRPPSVRTLARWLKQAGQVRRVKRRAPPGPAVRIPGRLRGRRCNDVWTVDLKGGFCTRDGRRINALTVRDLASRYLLCVRHVGSGGEATIGPVMRSLFRRYGLPRALRMDNGGPFGSLGPRGWTRLSASWIKLGVRLEYGRPGCPQDNPAHEQMHRVLKAQTATPPARHGRAQQRAFARWRHRYNHARPHESLGQRVPADLYRPSERTLPRRLPGWTYPAHWLVLRPNAKGYWRWAGSTRLIGRAFAAERLGAKRLRPESLAVYFGPHLLGTLHRSDPAGLRPVQWRTACKSGRGRGSAPPTPSRDLGDRCKP